MVLSPASEYPEGSWRLGVGKTIRNRAGFRAGELVRCRPETIRPVTRLGCERGIGPEPGRRTDAPRNPLQEHRIG